MTPALGLRDEVADLVILAWAALRTRAWYLHGGAIYRRRSRVRCGRTWSCGLSRCLTRLTGRRPRPDAEALFASHVNPYLTAAGVTELAARVSDNVECPAEPAIGLVPRWSSAYRQLGLPEDGKRDGLRPPGGERALTALQQAGGGKVRLMETLAQATMPGTETILGEITQEASAKRRASGFRWEQARSAARGGGGNRRTGQVRRQHLRELRETLRADEFASSIRRALVITDRRYSTGWPLGSAVRPAPALAPGPAQPGRLRPDGAGTRSAGAPDSEIVTAELAEFSAGTPWTGGRG